MVLLEEHDGIGKESGHVHGLGSFTRSARRRSRRLTLAARSHGRRWSHGRDIRPRSRVYNFDVAICAMIQLIVAESDLRADRSRRYTFGPYCSCSKALDSVPSGSLRVGASAGLRWWIRRGLDARVTRRRTHGRALESRDSSRRNIRTYRRRLESAPL